MSEPADTAERWILSRGRGEPHVYPFRSEADALDFALDHGMIDWRAERTDDPQEEHEAICHRCKEPWPCTHVRLDRQTAMILGAAKRTCHRCGKEIGGTLIRIEGGGPLGEDVAYHGRKGACRNMARRELARLGRHEDVARHDDEDRERERRAAWSRVWRKAHKEAVALGLTGREMFAYRSDAIARHMESEKA